MRAFVESSFNTKHPFPSHMLYMPACLHMFCMLLNVLKLFWALHVGFYCLQYVSLPLNMLRATVDTHPAFSSTSDVLHSDTQRCDLMLKRFCI